MNDSNGQTWWSVVALPAAFASIPGAIGFWQWWVSRKDKKADLQRREDMTVSERRDALLIAEREALTKEQLLAFERIEAERDRAIAEANVERVRRIAVEVDRDRGWNLGRYFHRLAGDWQHSCSNAEQMAESLAGRLSPPASLPAWRNPADVPIDMESVTPRAAE